LSYGIDITKNKIPVMPSSHYTCGGIMVDNYCCTNIENLYAVGECANTGLHGANRLASNSLLECVVGAKLAVKAIEKKLPSLFHGSKVNKICRNDNVNKHNHILSHSKTIKKIMWDYVGIIRDSDGLDFSKKQLLLIKSEIDDVFKNSQIDPDLLELRNLVQLAHLTVECAIVRQESRGGHFNLDFQKKEAKYDGRPTIAKKGAKPYVQYD